MADDNDETPVWLTVLKLVAIAVVLIVGTGWALWYVDQMQSRDLPSPGSGKAGVYWGIVTDSPLRPRR